MTDDNKPNKESFIRWQGRSLEELGKASSLILSLCLATIGFVISKFLDKDFLFKNLNSKCLVTIGSYILLISIISTLVMIYNRLSSFRKTTQIARKREDESYDGIEKLRDEVKKIDTLTWKLFNLSILTFSIGELIILAGFILEINSKK